MAYWTSRSVVLFVLLLECALGQQQRPCAVKGVNRLLDPTTSMTSVSMSCPVDEGAGVDVPDQFNWVWLRLDNNMDTPITNNITSGQLVSTYDLQVKCSSSGFYQALLYNSADNNTCLFSCFFVIEVKETRESALVQSFSIYPMVVSSMVPSVPGTATVRRARPEGSLQLLVGTCGNTFRNLASRCVADVSSQWYKNGSLFNPGADSARYILSTTGEVRIRNMSADTVGYYSCVTSVTGLGSYLTVDVDFALAIPTTPPPITTPSPPPETTTDRVGAPDNLFGTLMAWEFGLIIGVASLVIIVILLGGAVWMGRLTVKRRRDNRRRSKVQYRKAAPGPPHTRRPLSLIEEIQLMEEEGEEVDSPLTSSPVEIVFSCILFEELLHKGTFKVVHHGVVNQPSQGLLGVPVAVKRLKEEKSELGYEELMNEAVFLRTFQEKAYSHPNIVSLLGLTMRGGPTCLLLEYVPNGNLEDFLLALKLGPVPQWYVRYVRDTLRGAYHKHVSGDLMNIVNQVVDGMKYLTDQGLTHRDLSARNIMMGERLNIKIANPGMTHEGYYYVVTEREHVLQDMAPECLWENRYSSCSDVWSFGILVYRIVTLNATPFPNMEVDELHGRMMGGERPQLLASFSNELYFLLQRCWQFVASERPTFAVIRNDLSHMAEKPTRHIILKSTKDPAKPGYISESGQVFLRALPPHALEEDGPVQRKARHSIGTMRSLISSIDDTVYTRETAETVLDLQSETENENYNNYEQYLKGDLPLPLSAGTSRRSHDEMDNSGTDAKPKSKERVISASRKSAITQQDLEKDDTGSVGEVSRSSSKRKRKRRTPTKDKGHTGFTNKTFASTNNGAVEGREEGGVSSDSAPSSTEEEREKREGERSVGSDLSDSGSQTKLVML